MKNSVAVMNLFSVSQPSNGSRFAAFFDDASGCRIFIKADCGTVYDAYGEQDDLSDFSHWILLPDDYKFWFETREETT